VPDDAYDDPKKTFLWFLDRIQPSIERRILQLFYAVACHYKPELKKKTELEVAEMTIGDVYGPEPLELSVPKQDLQSRLREKIPDEFYPATGEPLRSASRTINEAIHQILYT